MSYEATGRHREADGRIVAGVTVGPMVTSVSSAADVEFNGKQATGQVMANERDQVSLEITDSDGTTERTRISRGESKNHIPRKKVYVVRIQVKEKS